MLKVGMVGMGGISHSHRKAWSQIPEAKVVSVCDIREENLFTAAKPLTGEHLCAAAGWYRKTDRFYI